MSDVNLAAWPAADRAVAAMVERAEVEIGPLAAEGMAEAGRAALRRTGSAGWCEPGPVEAAARLAVAAWAMATAGDPALLERVCDATHARFLLHPYGKDWVIAGGPQAGGPIVSRISIWALDTEADDTGGPDVVTLRASWDFTGRQHPAERAEGWRDPGDTEFTGMLAMALTGDGSFPWRLAYAHVDTVDGTLGYTYRTREETPSEYRERTGDTAPGPLTPSGSYRLTAGFTEPDYHFGGSATAEVASDPPPTRAQAQRIAEEAADAAARREMTRVQPGWDAESGDVRPSLTSVELIRLLEPAR
jgi:hypothetical protein